MEHTHVRLKSSATDENTYTYEEVAAVSLGSGRFRLLDSPWATFGCAKGDTLQIESDGSWSMVSRGGRVVLQVFTRHEYQLVLEALMGALRLYGASLDNKSRSGAAFSISLPAAVGYQVVRSAIDAAKLAHPQTDVLLSNLLDKDGNALNESWVSDFMRD